MPEVKKEIKADKRPKCKKCDGSGWEVRGEKVCPHCKGSGRS